MVSKCVVCETIIDAPGHKVEPQPRCHDCCNGYISIYTQDDSGDIKEARALARRSAIKACIAELERLLESE